jgi:hypothetical protein
MTSVDFGDPVQRISMIVDTGSADICKSHHCLLAVYIYSARTVFFPGMASCVPPSFGLRL